jgi:hypothetical protein
MRQRAKVNNWRGAVHNCIGINSGRKPGNTCGIGVALDDYPARETCSTCCTRSASAAHLQVAA